MSDAFKSTLFNPPHAFYFGNAQTITTTTNVGSSSRKKNSCWCLELYCIKINAMVSSPTSHTHLVLSSSFRLISHSMLWNGVHTHTRFHQFNLHNVGCIISTGYTTNLQVEFFFYGNASIRWAFLIRFGMPFWFL